MDRYPLQHDRNILHSSEDVNYICHYGNHVRHCAHDAPLYLKPREALALLIEHQRAGPDNSEPALSRPTWESQRYLSSSASIMGTAASQSIFQPIDTRTVSPVAGDVANSVWPLSGPVKRSHVIPLYSTWSVVVSLAFVDLL